MPQAFLMVLMLPFSYTIFDIKTLVVFQVLMKLVSTFYTSFNFSVKECKIVAACSIFFWILLPRYSLF